MEQTKNAKIAETQVIKNVTEIAKDVITSEKRRTPQTTESPYKTTKKAAILAADNELRGFNANVRAWESAYKVDPNVKDTFAADGVKLSNLTVDYLREYLPLRFNSIGVICQIKRNFEAFEGLEGVEIAERKGIKIALVPQAKWTAGQFYAMFKAAAKNDMIEFRNRCKETAKEARERAKEAREKAKYEELKAKFADETEPAKD